MNNTQLITVHELADYLHVNAKTIYRLLEKGNIPASRIGHLWRFDKSAIDAWLRQVPQIATANVLVIDDEEAVCSLFQDTLRESGHKITTVQESAKGLEMVKNGDFDLVFLDLMMPVMDGAAIFREIRKIKPELPVTIITGYPDCDLMMSALANGPFTVMKKPFTGADILSAVNSYLRFGASVSKY